MTQHDRLRAQYRKNADQMARMIAARRYRGATLEQLTACQERAKQCAEMSDAELSAHLADCRRQVSKELALMVSK